MNLIKCTQEFKTQIFKHEFQEMQITLHDSVKRKKLENETHLIEFTLLISGPTFEHTFLFCKKVTLI